jgi:hypothetical protein
MNDFEKIWAHGLDGTSDKWHHYFEVYDRHLMRLRKQPVRYLEIGVQRGGSLRMMQEYLGPDATVCGIDIDPACADNPAHRVFIGDQAEPAFLQHCVAQMQGVDIVIDDGGHVPDQQLISFITLFPLLNDGGVYIVEDLHTCFWDGYTASRLGINFYDYAKGLTDKLALWHLDRRFSDGRAFEPLEQRQGERKLNNFAAETIFSIAFYDSIVVFEKRRIAEPRRERR